MFHDLQLHCPIIFPSDLFTGDIILNKTQAFVKIPVSKALAPLLEPILTKHDEATISRSIPHVRTFRE